MRESVERPERGAPCCAALLEGVDQQRLGQALAALVLADGEPLDVPLLDRVPGHDQHRGADDLAGGVGDDPQHPRLVAGPAYGHGEEVLEGSRSRTDHSRKASSTTFQTAS